MEATVSIRALQHLENVIFRCNFQAVVVISLSDGAAVAIASTLVWLAASRLTAIPSSKMSISTLRLLSHHFLDLSLIELQLLSQPH